MSHHAYKLTVLRGKNVGKEFLLKDTLVLVGRKDVTARLYPPVDLEEEDEAAKVSRRHAHLHLDDQGGFELEDLGSLNGSAIVHGGVTTLIPAGERASVVEGDDLVFGEVVLRVSKV